MFAECCYNIISGSCHPFSSLVLFIWCFCFFHLFKCARLPISHFRHSLRVCFDFVLVV
uniref:Ovule protein n=1 Tax=Ascaris lumbricoides TaxID=6252 RepID=A0A0M3HMU4_ASCLU